MQGIFSGFPLLYHDAAWTCILDLAMDERTGKTQYGDAITLLMMSGFAGVIRE